MAPWVTFPGRPSLSLCSFGFPSKPPWHFMALGGSIDIFRRLRANVTLHLQSHITFSKQLTIFSSVVPQYFACALVYIDCDHSGQGSLPWEWNWNSLCKQIDLVYSRISSSSIVKWFLYPTSSHFISISSTELRQTVDSNCPLMVWAELREKIRQMAEAHTFNPSTQEALVGGIPELEASLVCR